MFNALTIIISICMEIFESLTVLAILFATTFCSMEIIWRLHLRIQAAQASNQEEKQEAGQKISTTTNI